MTELDDWMTKEEMEENERKHINDNTLRAYDILVVNGRWYYRQMNRKPARETDSFMRNRNSA